MGGRGKSDDARNVPPPKCNNDLEPIKALYVSPAQPNDHPLQRQTKMILFRAIGYVL
jgi:hypothetical protein